MSDEYIKKQPLLNKARAISGDVFAVPRIIAEIENAPTYCLDLLMDGIDLLVKNHPATKYPNCVIVGGSIDALVYTKSLEDYDRFLHHIQSEARKEFAERLKENAVVGAGTRYASYRMIDVWEINNLLAEMESERE